MRFWVDKWLGIFTLQHIYPSMYNIVQRKNVSVASMLSSVPLNVSFRRGVVNANLHAWYIVVELVMQIQLNEVDDIFEWSLHQSKTFSARSMYGLLISRYIVR